MILSVFSTFSFRPTCILREDSGFQDGKDSSRGPLGCDTVQWCSWIPRGHCYLHIQGESGCSNVLIM